MKCASLIMLTFLVTIILLYPSAATAQDFIIKDGDIYLFFAVSESVFGFPTPRVDMTGGHVGNEDFPGSGMFTYDSSTLNVSGGTIDYLHTYNSSTVNISGGLVSHYSCWDTQTISSHNCSTINVYDGASLRGGSFHHFTLYDSSTVNVYGGDVVLFLMPYDSSTVNIYDGKCSFGIIHHDYSTTNVYGGYIDFYTDGNVPATATVNIYGYGFNYNPQWISKLTGFGPDGTAITYWGLPDPSTHPNINLIPDFVLDRGVDMADFAVLAFAWRSQKGDVNWNRYCDISDPNDDVIDERDLDILTKYWLAGVSN